MVGTLTSSAHVSISKNPLTISDLIGRFMDTSSPQLKKEIWPDVQPRVNHSEIYWLIIVYFTRW